MGISQTEFKNPDVEYIVTGPGMYDVKTLMLRTQDRTAAMGKYAELTEWAKKHPQPFPFEVYEVTTTKVV